MRKLIEFYHYIKWVFQNRKMIQKYQDQLDDLFMRSEMISENPKIMDADIHCFVELKLKKEHCYLFDQNFLFGGIHSPAYHYYMRKVHNNLVLKSGKMTTREDNGDFQHIFNLGIQILKDKYHGKR